MDDIDWKAKAQAAEQALSELKGEVLRALEPFAWRLSGSSFRALSSLHEKLSSIGGSSSAETAASLADGKLTAGEAQRKSEGFSVRDLAEVATKAIYTHGFGFREVVGPSEHQGRQYVNFCWDDNTLVRAIFWMSPDEALPPPPNPSARGEL